MISIDPKPYLETIPPPGKHESYLSDKPVYLASIDRYVYNDPRAFILKAAEAFNELNDREGVWPTISLIEAKIGSSIKTQKELFGNQENVGGMVAFIDRLYDLCQAAAEEAFMIHCPKRAAEYFLNNRTSTGGEAENKEVKYSFQIVSR